MKGQGAGGVAGAGVQPLTVRSFCRDGVVLCLLRVKQEIGGFLGFGCGLEDHALVVLQGAQPPFDICARLPKVGGQAKMRANHAISDFGNQFLERISLAIVEFLEPIKAALRACPMGLMPMSA